MERERLARFAEKWRWFLKDGDKFHDWFLAEVAALARPEPGLGAPSLAPTGVDPRVEMCDGCFYSAWVPVPTEGECALVHPHKGVHVRCDYCWLRGIWERDTIAAKILADPEKAHWKREWEEQWNRADKAEAEITTLRAQLAERTAGVHPSEPGPQGAAQGAPAAGSREALYRALVPLLRAYGCDEPHWDEEGSGYYPVGTFEEFQADLASKHDGDCTKQPQPCIRCHAESVSHEARWIAERMLFPSPTGAAPRDAITGALGARAAEPPRADDDPRGA